MQNARSAGRSCVRGRTAASDRTAGPTREAGRPAPEESAPAAAAPAASRASRGRTPHACVPTARTGHRGDMSTTHASAPVRSIGPAAGWVLTLVAVAVVGGLATDTSSSWYRGLDLPPFQPPGAVFGIVWTVLYAMIAIAGILTTRAAASDRRTVALRLFAVNLVLNVGWTWIFFQGEAPVAAGVEVVVLLAVTLALIAAVRRVAPTAALLLLPYAAWVAFAAALTWTIAATN